MQSYIKTPVTLAKIYVTFEAHESEFHTPLFLGKLTRKEIQETFKTWFGKSDFKAIKILEVQRVELTIDFTGAFVNKTLEDFIIEHAHNTLEFEYAIVG